MESIEPLVILISILLIAGVSRRIRHTVVTLPILYVLFGLGVGLLFKDQIKVFRNAELVEVIAGLTLTLMLATDASRITIHRLFRYHDLPLRLLAIGVPLAIGLGAVLAALLFGELGIWGAAVLGVILAPTDASVAENVMENPKVPMRIRQALNVESSLNDGVALPFLLLFLSLAVSNEVGIGSGYYLRFATEKIVFGILAGVATGYLAARYIHWGLESGWMSDRFRKICWLALVILTFWVAEQFNGNGYIAAFCFGITSGNTLSKRESESLYQYAEVENALLMLVTYIIFGMVMLPRALEYIDLTIVLYAVLSLTVVRMLPVAISMLGAKLRGTTILFLGWFGPRGIASILYVLTVLGTDDIAGRETIYAVAMITVFFSVMAHGISAAPLANWYGERMVKLDEKGLADAETASVPEMPTRARRAPAGTDPPSAAYSSG